MTEPIKAVSGQRIESPSAWKVRPRAGGKLNSKMKPAEMARFRRATQEFEAIFVEHMLKTSRQSSAKGGLLPSGSSGDMYRGMADQELARAVSRAGGLGLGDLLSRHMIGADAKKVSRGAIAGPIPLSEGKGIPGGYP